MHPYATSLIPLSPVIGSVGLDPALGTSRRLLRASACSAGVALRSLPMEIGPFLLRLLPVLSALAVASIVETLMPLRKQARQANGRLTTNLWLLAITLALGILLNFTLALGAAYLA